jgi:hypothetical protein
MIGCSWKWTVFCPQGEKAIKGKGNGNSTLPPLSPKNEIELKFIYRFRTFLSADQIGSDDFPSTVRLFYARKMRLPEVDDLLEDADLSRLPIPVRERIREYFVQATLENSARGLLL